MSRWIKYQGGAHRRLESDISGLNRSGGEVEFPALLPTGVTWYVLLDLVIG